MKEHKPFEKERRRKGAFMGDTLTQSEQKAIADSIKENREALEIMAKH